MILVPEKSRDGASATEEEIVAHCRQLLAGFKVPKAVRFGELPKTSPGKIQKYLLRNEVQSAKAITA
jgi:fatty-acyl-CoA synthase